MPIVLQSPATIPSGVTFTAQDIVNESSVDLRKQLASSGADAAILLQWVDRIHKEVLRSSKWRFLLSSPQRFVTQVGITDYLIGSGTSPLGTYNTGLALTDIFRMSDNDMMDRSNNIRLYRTFFQPPNATTFEYPDGQSRPLRPTNFYHENYSTVLRIYPAPNNQSTYQPVPESPICTTQAGGSLPARTYTVKYSIVDSSGGESIASGTPTTIFIPANSLLVVSSPSFPLTGTAAAISYNKYKVYAANNNLGNEVVQNGGAAISSGSSFVEPNGGIVTGTSAPLSVGTIAPMLGYIIEFKYWQQRSKLTTLGASLQVPDDYKDVLIAGVNWLGYAFFDKPMESKMWFQTYQQGIREMVRDQNQFEQAGEFLRPDVQSQSFPPALIPGFITGS